MTQKMTIRHMTVLLSVVLCCFITISLSSTCWSLYVVPISEDLGIDRSSVSLIYTFQSIPQIILSFFAYKVFQRFNIRTVYGVTAAIAMVGTILMARGQSLLIILIGAFLNGVCVFGCAYMTGGMLIANWFVKAKGTMVGIMSAAGSLGGVIMSPIMSNIITNSGWRSAMMLAAVLNGGVVILSALLFTRDRPSDFGLKPYGAPLEETDSSIVGAEMTEVPGLTFTEAKKQASFYGVIVLKAISTLALVCMSTHQIAMMQDKGFTLGQASIALSVYSFVGMLNKLVSGVITDKFGFRCTCIYCGVGFILGVVCMMIGSGYAFMIAYAVLAAFWSAIIGSYTMMANVHLFGSKDIGAIMGWSNMTGSIAAMIGPTLAGLIYTASGSYTIVQCAAIIMVAVFIVGSIVLFSDKNAYNNRFGKKVENGSTL